MDVFFGSLWAEKDEVFKMALPALQDCYLPRYNYEDYCLWEGSWELMFGLPYAMTPAPLIIHQEISHRIDVQLGNLLQQCQRCRALLPVDWKIAEDTVVQPDNLVVCYEPQGAYLTKAPSLIFEIVSKSSRRKDEKLKYNLYEQEGVKYYCLVFPDDNVAKLFVLKEGRYIKYGDLTDEQVEMSLIDDCLLSFDFSKIWP